MKVFAFVSVDDHIISSFHRATTNINPHGADAMNGLTPILVDIAIPCGVKFDIPPNYCNRCRWNDPESCDVIKYTRGVWSTGELFKKPKVVQYRKYKIEIDKLLSGDSLLSVQGKEKTVPQMINILAIALVHEFPITEIKEV